MKLKRIVISLFWMASSSFAQTSPTNPTSGPTVQESIGFISDLYAKQGSIQVSSNQLPGLAIKYSRSFSLENSCSLVIKETVTTFAPAPLSNGFLGRTSVLDLARSEPTSLSIKTDSTGSPVLHSIIIEQAYGEWRSMVDAIDESAPVPLSPGTKASGRVRSNTGNTILFVSTDGRLMSYTPDKKVKLETFIGSTSTYKGVTIGDFETGDAITIDSKRTLLTKIPEYSQTIHKPGIGSFGIVEVTDSEAVNRMAKALIHAMVLCHKDDKPSLF